MLCCFLNASSINRFFPADICIRVAFRYDFSHNNDVIISAMTSQITGVSIVYRLFTGGPWFAPTKGPVTRKMFPFDDFIMSKLNPRERLMGRRKKCSLQVHNLIYSLLLVFWRYFNIQSWSGYKVALLLFYEGTSTYADVWKIFIKKRLSSLSERLRYKGDMIAVTFP